MSTLGTEMLEFTLNGLVMLACCSICFMLGMLEGRQRQQNSEKVGQNKKGTTL